MSTNNFCLPASDLHQIGWEMVREFQTETISRFGDARGLGAVRAGQYITGDTGTGGNYRAVVSHPESNEYGAVGANLWVFQPLFDLPPPDYGTNAPTEPEEIATGGRALLGLVKWEDARQWLSDLAVRVAQDVVNKLADEALDRIMRRAPGGFVGEACRQVAAYVLRRQLKNALAKAAARLLSRSSYRYGPQRIVTRRRVGVNQGWVKFSGRWAWKQGRGRPALPASEWLRRYRARRKPKTNRRGRRTMKAPPTKYRRPRVLFGFRKQGLQTWQTIEPIDRDAAAETAFEEIIRDVESAIRAVDW
jgi:hypothetical protein